MFLNKGNVCLGLCRKGWLPLPPLTTSQGMSKFTWHKQRSRSNPGPEKKRGEFVQKKPESCFINRIQRNVPLWKEKEASKSDFYGEYYKLWRKWPHAAALTPELLNKQSMQRESKELLNSPLKTQTVKRIIPHKEELNYTGIGSHQLHSSRLIT